MQSENLVIKGYERVIRATDPERGFLAYVAIDDTTLGPALGCLSLRPHEGTGDPLTAVLHVAEAMTWKAAAADLAVGGGPIAGRLLTNGFPTCALATFELDIEGWDEVDGALARLVAFEIP